MERYEIAIIGTGAAGVSAAITAKLRQKKILLLGRKNLSEKIQKAHTIYNYPGLPATSGKALVDAWNAHLESMEIPITEDRIHAVYAMGDYFALQGIHQNYESKTLILATGVHAGKTYPGEQEYLGRGVSYCATCDAPLYRGKTAAIVGFSANEEEEAAYMAQIAEKVFYFPMYPENVQLSNASNLQVIREIPTAVEGDLKARRLITQNNTYEVDGIFFLREQVAPSQLVPGLLMEGNHIAVDRKMATNLAGCFACGDVVGTPYQYIKAAGEGNVAALSAVRYLGGNTNGKENF